MRSSPGWRFTDLRTCLRASARLSLRVCTAALLRPTVSAVAVAAFVPATICAQAGVVTGSVTDAASRSAIAGASVIIEGTTLGVTTGSDGRYRLASVPAGTYTLVARRIGFAQQRKSATVGSSGELIGLVTTVSIRDDV